MLAHQFGHYHSGDVKIGPWIYKTRSAIGRTIAKLHDSSLQKVFVAYGNIFLRVTHAVSRRQEFIADEVAAHAAGAAAMASALRKVHGSALAFNNYWRAGVSPLLNSGFLPPLVAGFARFVQAESVSSQVAESILRGRGDRRVERVPTRIPRCASASRRSTCFRPAGLATHVLPSCFSVTRSGGNAACSVRR